jgi:hypothetical protein
MVKGLHAMLTKQSVKDGDADSEPVVRLLDRCS